MSCLCIIAFNIYDLFPFNANGEALEMNSNLYQEGEYDVDIKAQKHEKNHEDNITRGRLKKTQEHCNTR